jgi:hypothetical protein
MVTSGPRIAGRAKGVHMPVTIKLNGDLTLSHKGSGGWVKCTLPDVCNTPSPGGLVPVPYPTVFSFSKDLQNGTRTVKADGGNSCSIAGSEYSTAYGDEPGSGGGIISGVNMKQATWLTYSFNVKMENQGVCRLTDKMLMNQGNTASLCGGDQEIYLPFGPRPLDLWQEVLLCLIFCECNAAGKFTRLWLPQQTFFDKDFERLYEGDYDPLLKPDPFGNQACVEAELRAGRYRNIIPEQTYDMRTFQPLDDTHRGLPGTRRPDVVITHDPALPPAGRNLRCIVEMKFPTDPLSSPRAIRQLAAYWQIAEANNPNATVEVLTSTRCRCQQRKRREEEERTPVYIPPITVDDRQKKQAEEEKWKRYFEEKEKSDRRAILYIMAIATAFVVVPEVIAAVAGTEATAATAGVAAAAATQ